MARRALSEADRQAWAAYARTVRRLALEPGPPARPVPPVHPSQAAAQPAPSPAAPAPPMPKPAAATAPAPNVAPPGLDTSTWRRFTTAGQAERRLDLHGLTAAQAHRAVLDFIGMAVAARLRCVEIITGNGAILERELPHWLETPALGRHILALAHPHARNTGALRILLRRGRFRPGAKRIDAATPGSSPYRRFT